MQSHLSSPEPEDEDDDTPAPAIDFEEIIAAVRSVVGGTSDEWRVCSKDHLLRQAYIVGEMQRSGTDQQSELSPAVTTVKALAWAILSIRKDHGARA